MNKKFLNAFLFGALPWELFRLVRTTTTTLTTCSHRCQR